MRGFLLAQIQRLGLLSIAFGCRSHPYLCPLISSFSNGYCNFIFVRAFRREPSPHSHTLLHSLYFSNFQPPSVQPAYNPADFIDIETRNSLNDELGVTKIVELVHKTKDCNSRKEVIDFLVDSGINPDANQVYLALWRLRSDWNLAFLAFQMIGKWGCISEKILGLIVWVLGSHQKFDIAWTLIRDSYRVVDTRDAMLAIIDRYAAANNHEKAIRTFHFTDKLWSDHNAYHFVISALCRYGNVEEAEEFMLNNKKLFPLETQGFNIILHGWCVISVDVVEAKRVWREMASYCIIPDAMSYTHMICCLSKVGNLFESIRLYDEMKQRGWTPGVDVYNFLIYVMAHENCLSEALKIIERLKEMGLQPDSKSYNCLICPLCEAGKFEEARNYMSLMTQEGAQPTIETYEAFLKGANLEDTFAILNQMKNDKVGPDNFTFLLVFDRFFKLREPENALKVWVEMRDFGVHPELGHYMSVISGLVNCGCFIKAKELHTEMLATGHVDDPELKKLLQGSEQGILRGRVEPMNFVRHGKKSNYISAHRGRIK